MPRALLVNPFEKTLTEVDHDGELHSIYAALDCASTGIDTVALSPVCVMYVDDEGLFKPEQRFFQLVPGAPVIGGKAIIFGLDAEGGNISHDLIVDKVRDACTFPDIVFDGTKDSVQQGDHPAFGEITEFRSVARFRDRETGRPWFPTITNEGFADDNETTEDQI